MRGKENDEESEKAEEKITKEKKKPEGEEKQRMVHAPYFPQGREECWWIVLGFPRGAGNVGQLVGIRKIGNIDQVAEGKLKFAAPPTPGMYGFTAHLICDGYIGMDKKVDFKLKVVKDNALPTQPTNKEEEEDSDSDDYSDEEEDESKGKQIALREDSGEESE